MKLKTIDNPVTFKPITLAITFESVEELQEMFNRMNKPNPPESNTFPNAKATGMHTKVFDWVNDTLKNLGDKS